MEKLFTIIYAQPLYKIIISIILLVLLWGYLGKKLKLKQWWKIFNFIVFVVVVGVILYMTVYSRTERTGGLILIPFRSFFEAKKQPELYRSMLMNVFLFVPIGLSLPFALSENKHPVVITVVMALVFSVSIEVIQFIFALGVCEMDDVIMNTLGAMIGTLGYRISRKSKWCVG